MINGKPLILAVDDEENIRNLITYTFEEYDIEVKTAENGKAAITILEQNPVDVIITDLLMPGNTEMVKEIIAEGVFRLIEKPLDFEILVPIVQDALEYRNKNSKK